jgi:hypothetical protein
LKGVVSNGFSKCFFPTRMTLKATVIATKYYYVSCGTPAEKRDTYIKLVLSLAREGSKV